ncbi:MAG: PEP/pyruvate-binding domain-containing protein [Candidatus Omnitrophota bacterium]
MLSQETWEVDSIDIQPNRKYGMPIYARNNKHIADIVYEDNARKLMPKDGVRAKSLTEVQKAYLDIKNGKIVSRRLVIVGRKTEIVGGKEIDAGTVIIIKDLDFRTWMSYFFEKDKNGNYTGVGYKTIGENKLAREGFVFDVTPDFDPEKEIIIRYDEQKFRGYFKDIWDLLKTMTCPGLDMVRVDKELKDINNLIEQDKSKDALKKFSKLRKWLLSQLPKSETKTIGKITGVYAKLSAFVKMKAEYEIAEFTTFVDIGREGDYVYSKYVKDKDVLEKAGEKRGSAGRKFIAPWDARTREAGHVIGEVFNEIDISEEGEVSITGELDIAPIGYDNYDNPKWQYTQIVKAGKTRFFVSPYDAEEKEANHVVGEVKGEVSFEKRPDGGREAVLGKVKILPIGYDNYDNPKWQYTQIVKAGKTRFFMSPYDAKEMEANHVVGEVKGDVSFVDTAKSGREAVLGKVKILPIGYDNYDNPKWQYTQMMSKKTGKVRFFMSLYDAEEKEANHVVGEVKGEVSFEKRPDGGRKAVLGKVKILPIGYDNYDNPKWQYTQIVKAGKTRFFMSPYNAEEKEANHVVGEVKGEVSFEKRPDGGREVKLGTVNILPIGYDNYDNPKWQYTQMMSEQTGKTRVFKAPYSAKEKEANHAVGEMIFETNGKEIGKIKFNKRSDNGIDVKTKDNVFMNPFGYDSYDVPKWQYIKSLKDGKMYFAPYDAKEKEAGDALGRVIKGGIVISEKGGTVKTDGKIVVIPIGYYMYNGQKWQCTQYFDELTGKARVFEALYNTADREAGPAAREVIGLEFNGDGTVDRTSRQVITEYMYDADGRMFIEMRKDPVEEKIAEVFSYTYLGSVEESDFPEIVGGKRASELWQELTVKNKYIRPDGTGAVLPAFKKLKSFSEMNLSNTFVSDKKAIYDFVSNQAYFSRSSRRVRKKVEMRQGRETIYIYQTKGPLVADELNMKIGRLKRINYQDGSSLEFYYGENYVLVYNTELDITHLVLMKQNKVDRTKSVKIYKGKYVSRESIVDSEFVSEVKFSRDKKEKAGAEFLLNNAWGLGVLGTLSNVTSKRDYKELEKIILADFQDALNTNFEYVLGFNKDRTRTYVEQFLQEAVWSETDQLINAKYLHPDTSLIWQKLIWIRFCAWEKIAEKEIVKVRGEPEKWKNTMIMVVNGLLSKLHNANIKHDFLREKLTDLDRKLRQDLSASLIPVRFEDYIDSACRVMKGEDGILYIIRNDSVDNKHGHIIGQVINGLEMNDRGEVIKTGEIIITPIGYDDYRDPALMYTQDPNGRVYIKPYDADKGKAGAIKAEIIDGIVLPGGGGTVYSDEEKIVVPVTYDSQNRLMLDSIEASGEKIFVKPVLASQEKSRHMIVAAELRDNMEKYKPVKAKWKKRIYYPEMFVDGRKREVYADKELNIEDGEHLIVLKPDFRIKDTTNSNLVFLMRMDRVSGKFKDVVQDWWKDVQPGAYNEVDVIAMDSKGKEKRLRVEIEKTNEWHLVIFSPASRSCRYELEEAKDFDPANVVEYRIKFQGDDAKLVRRIKKLHIEHREDVSGKTQEGIVKLLLDPEKAIVPFQIAKVKSRGLEKGQIEGLLYLDVKQNNRPVNYLGQNIDISGKIPAPYNKITNMVRVSFVDAGGNLYDARLPVNPNGSFNGIVTAGLSGDFDPTHIVRVETRWVLTEQSPLNFIRGKFGLFPDPNISNRVERNYVKYAIYASILIFVLALGIAGLNYGESKKRKKQLELTKGTSKGGGGPPPEESDVSGPGVDGSGISSAEPLISSPDSGKAGSLDDDGVKKEIDKAIKGIETWTKGLDLDFRDRRAKVEDKDMFLPRLRGEELWDFFDPNKISRFNISVSSRAVSVFTMAAVLLPFFGFSRMIVLLPYAVLTIATLLPNYNFLNIQKVFKFFLQSGMILLSQTIASGIFGISLVNFSLFAGFVAAFILAVSPYLRYLNRLTDAKDITKNQRAELERAKIILESIQENKPLMAKIGKLRRFRRSFEAKAGEDLIDEEFEAGQPEKIFKTPEFETVLNNAISQIDGLLKDEVPQEKSGIILKDKGFGKIGAIGAVSAFFGVILLVYKVTAFLSVPSAYQFIIILALSVIGLNYLSLEAKKYLSKNVALFEPAEDMRAIFRQKETDLFTRDGSPLETLDIWRFLVEAREGVRTKMVTAETKTYQEGLDIKRNGFINNRDTGIARTPFDSRPLEDTNRIFSWKKIMVVWWIGGILGLGMYLFGLGSLWFIAQLFNFVGTGRLLSWGAMYQRSFGMIKVFGAIKGYAAGKIVFAEVLRAGLMSIPTIFAQMFSFVVIGSVALFCLKYFYYAYGARAKKHIGEKKITWKNYAWPSIKALVTGSLLFGVPLFTGAGIALKFNVGVGLIVNIFLGTVFFHSLFDLYMSIITRKAFKGIVEEDKLYEGEDQDEVERATKRFRDTYIRRFSLLEIQMIARLNKQVEQGVKWKNVDEHDRIKYEKLFGKGARPSGSIYNISDTASRKDISRALVNTYNNLTRDELIKRMSGKGFQNMVERFGLDKELKIWDIQDNPSLISQNDVNEARLRAFLDEHPNEKRLIQMFDFMPKVQNWVVVVMGDEGQVMDLVQVLGNFRYPYQRLKIIVAGEAWDDGTTQMIQRLQRENKIPGEKYCQIAPAPAREKKQAYTKPGANTFCLRPEATDGAYGLIFDAEDIPDNLMVLKMITGVIEGVAETRRLSGENFSVRLDEAIQKAPAVKDKASVAQKIKHYKKIAEQASVEYTRALGANDWVSVCRMNFKRGNVLKRHLRWFTTHALKELLLLAQENKTYISPALVWLRIKKLNQDPENNKKRIIALMDLYSTIATMPDYGEIATEYINKDINEHEFIKHLIIGEFERINMPKNGQGRLSQDRNALSARPWLTGAFFRGEYSAWYTMGWDGFHAVQDTFKPLGGTTGWFCTEPTEEIYWNDINSGLLTENPKAYIKKEYERRNKLLSLGAWDEMQVAEDYELGLVLWFRGFNVSNFYTLTSEDPAAATSLTFEVRALQTSRWNKGYVIGLLQFVGEGRLFQLYRKKGISGVTSFLAATLASAVFPLMFRMAKIFALILWVSLIPINVIGPFLIKSFIGPVFAWFETITHAGTFISAVHLGIREMVSISLNFMPKGWAWGVGPVIALGMIIIHSYYTVASIFEGPDDELGYDTALDMFDEFYEKLYNQKGKNLKKADHNINAMKEAMKSLEETGYDIKAMRQAVESLEKAMDKIKERHEIEGQQKEKIKENSEIEGRHEIKAMRQAVESLEKEMDEIKAMRQAVESLEEAMKNINAMKETIESLENGKYEIKKMKQAVEAGQIHNDFTLLNGQKEKLSLLSPLKWITIASLFFGSLAAIVFSAGIISFCGIMVGVAGISWAVMTGLGRWYIQSAPTDKQKAIRAMRFRLAMANMFIPFYHMMYLYGNAIAWNEIGPRIGYWWLTPRAADMEQEVTKRYLPVSKPDPLYTKENIKKSFRRFSRYFIIGPGPDRVKPADTLEYTLDKKLKETKLRTQANLNFAFVAGIFYTIALGLRIDIKDFLLTKKIGLVVLKGVLPVNNIFLLSAMIIAGIAAVGAWLFYKNRKWHQPEKDIPWDMTPLKQKTSWTAYIIKPFKVFVFLVILTAAFVNRGYIAEKIKPAEPVTEQVIADDRIEAGKNIETMVKAPVPGIRQKELNIKGIKTIAKKDGKYIIIPDFSLHNGHQYGKMDVTLEEPLSLKGDTLSARFTVPEEFLGIEQIPSRVRFFAEDRLGNFQAGDYHDILTAGEIREIQFSPRDKDGFNPKQIKTYGLQFEYNGLTNCKTPIIVESIGPAEKDEDSRPSLRGVTATRQSEDKEEKRRGIIAQSTQGLKDHAKKHWPKWAGLFFILSFLVFAGKAVFNKIFEKLRKTRIQKEDISEKVFKEDKKVREEYNESNVKDFKVIVKKGEKYIITADFSPLKRPQYRKMGVRMERPANLKEHVFLARITVPESFLGITGIPSRVKFFIEDQQGNFQSGEYQDVLTAEKQIDVSFEPRKKEGFNIKKVRTYGLQFKYNGLTNCKTPIIVESIGPAEKDEDSRPSLRGATATRQSECKEEKRRGIIAQSTQELKDHAKKHWPKWAGLLSFLALLGLGGETLRRKLAEKRKKLQVGAVSDGEPEADGEQPSSLRATSQASGAAISIEQKYGEAVAKYPKYIVMVKAGKEEESIFSIIDVKGNLITSMNFSQKKIGDDIILKFPDKFNKLPFKVTRQDIVSAVFDVLYKRTAPDVMAENVVISVNKDDEKALDICKNIEGKYELLMKQRDYRTTIALSYPTNPKFKQKIIKQSDYAIVPKTSADKDSITAFFLYKNKDDLTFMPLKEEELFVTGDLPSIKLKGLFNWLSNIKAEDIINAFFEAILVEAQRKGKSEFHIRVHNQNDQGKAFFAAQTKRWKEKTVDARPDMGDAQYTCYKFKCEDFKDFQDQTPGFSKDGKKLALDKQNSLWALWGYGIFTILLSSIYLGGVRNWFSGLPLLAFAGVVILYALQTMALHGIRLLPEPVVEGEDIKTALIPPFMPNMIDVFPISDKSEERIVYVMDGKTYVNVEEMAKHNKLMQYLFWFHEWFHLKGIESHPKLYLAQGAVFALGFLLFMGTCWLSVTGASAAIGAVLSGKMSTKYVMLMLSPFAVAIISQLMAPRETLDIENVSFGTGHMAIIKDYLLKDGTIDAENIREENYPPDIGSDGTATQEYAEKYIETRISESFSNGRVLKLGVDLERGILTIYGIVPDLNGEMKMEPAGIEFYKTLEALNNDSEFRAFIVRNKELFKNLEFYIIGDKSDEKKHSAHPHLFTCKGYKWQAASSGTRQGRSAAVYMTRPFFEDMPLEIKLPVLYEQILRAALLHRFWENYGGNLYPRGDLLRIKSLQERITADTVIDEEIRNVVKNETALNRDLSIRAETLDQLDCYLEGARTEWQKDFGELEGGVFADLERSVRALRKDIEDMDYEKAIDGMGIIMFKLSSIMMKKTDIAEFAKNNNDMILFMSTADGLSKILRKYVAKNGIYNRNEGQGLSYGRAVGKIVIVKDASEFEDLRVPLKRAGVKLMPDGKTPAEDIIWVVPEMLAKDVTSLGGEKVVGIIMSVFGAGHAQNMADDEAIPIAVIPDAVNFLDQQVFRDKYCLLRVNEKGYVRFRLAAPSDIENKDRYKRSKPDKGLLRIPEAVLDGELVYKLGDVDRFFINRVGAKAANIGELMNIPELKEVAPPDGIALTFTFCDKFLEEAKYNGSSINSQIQAALQEIQDEYGMRKEGVSDKEISAKLKVIRDLIVAAKMPDFEKTILDNIKSLREQYGNTGFFVRSSFNFEDLLQVNAAGQYESYPDLDEMQEVSKDAQIIEAVKRVIATKYSQSAFNLRQKYRVNDEDVFPGVIIQVPAFEIDSAWETREECREYKMYIKDKDAISIQKQVKAKNDAIEKAMNDGNVDLARIYVKFNDIALRYLTENYKDNGISSQQLDELKSEHNNWRNMLITSGVINTWNSLSEDKGEMQIIAGRGISGVVGDHGRLAQAIVNKHRGTRKVWSLQPFASEGGKKIWDKGRLIPFGTTKVEARAKILSAKTAEELADISKIISRMWHCWTQDIEWMIAPDGKKYIVQNRSVPIALPHDVNEPEIFYMGLYRKILPKIKDQELNEVKSFYKKGEVLKLFECIDVSGETDAKLQNTDPAKLAKRIIALFYLEQLMKHWQNRKTLAEDSERIDQMIKFAGEGRNIYSQFRMLYLLGALNDVGNADRIKAYAKTMPVLVGHISVFAFAELCGQMGLYKEAITALEDRVYIDNDKTSTFVERVFDIVDRYVLVDEAIPFLDRISAKFAGQWQSRQARILINKIKEQATVLVGIPAKIYDDLSEDSMRKLGANPLICPVKINGSVEPDMLDDLEKQRIRHFASAAILIDVEADISEIIARIDKCAGEIKDRAFILGHPEIRGLNETTVKEIENIESLVTDISRKYLDAISSLTLDSSSLYQLRIRKTFKKFSQGVNNLKFTPEVKASAEEHYLIHYADGRELLNRTRTIVPLGLEIQKRRQKMKVSRSKDKFYDKIFVMAPERVVSDEDKAIFKQTLIKLWMLEGVLNDTDVHVIDRHDGGYSTSEIYGRVFLSSGEVANKGNTGFNCIAGELEYDKEDFLQINLGQGAKNNINQYEVFVNLLISKDKDWINGLNKGTLVSINGSLYLYLSGVEAIDLEAEIRNYERYVLEVLVKA